jgi:Flp pilus assembly pilin Flp
MLRAALRSLGERVPQLQLRTAGQDLIEYALLLALISTTVLFSLTAIGAKVPGFYEDTAAALPSGPGEDPGDPKGNPGNDKPAGDAGEDPSGKGN